MNIASTEGLGATKGGSPYTAAKHGVIGLTRSLAVEAGSEGITVNCICPGPINTGMTQAIPEEQKIVCGVGAFALKRYAEPEEVAHGTLNFCLPSSGFMTGAALPVDGLDHQKCVENGVIAAGTGYCESQNRQGLLSTTLAFGAPAIGAGYMYLILSLYVMKFSTDVLLIAPAVMGAIFSLSRIWDAISDPLVGYLSDRTTLKLGRRTWILGSCLPISVGFYAVFAPPFSMQGDDLTLDDTCHHWFLLGNDVVFCSPYGLG